MRRYYLSAAAALGMLTVGCEGDLPLRMVQQDVDAMRGEVAVVAGTRQHMEDRLRRIEDRLEKSERTRAVLEEKLGRAEAELKSQSAKTVQERQAFLQSQAALTVKLDELATSVRLSQGQTEGIGHGITEANRRVDELGRRLDQIGQRLAGSETGQAVAAAQEAAAVARQASAASQQTAQQVTAALQQMAQQTNAAIEQINATAQLALTEARKTGKGKPITGPGSSRAAPRPVTPAVASITMPPPISPAPATQAPVPEIAPAVSAGRTTEPALPPAQTAKPAPRVESADELYRNALNDYAKGEYDLAISGFRNHLEIYPNSSLAPNARYWLGESYYSRKAYDQAIREFALLVKQHPDNPKVASAMLKQGLAYLEIGDKSKARTVLDNLLKQYPKSQEARRAKERLGQVK